MGKGRKGRGRGGTIERGELLHGRSGHHNSVGSDDGPCRRTANVAKSVLSADQSGPNLLKPDAWRAWQAGFERDGESFVCDNGADAEVQRGASQTVVLNQTVPEPIVATA